MLDSKIDSPKLWAHQIESDPARYPRTSIEASLKALATWQIEWPEKLIARAVSLGMLKDTTSREIQA